MDPLRWVRIPLGEWDSYGACRAEGNQYIIFVSLVGAINLSALFLACYQAYRAREISDEYSETRYIAVACGSMLQLTVVGLPLLFLVHDNPSALFFMQAAILFVISMAVLLLIFVPKVIYMNNFTRISQKKSRAEQERMLLQASRGINYQPAGPSLTTSSECEASQHDGSGIIILSHGTKSMQADIDDLKLQVAVLKRLLAQHNIDYDEGAVTSAMQPVECQSGSPDGAESSAREEFDIE